MTGADKDIEKLIEPVEADASLKPDGSLKAPVRRYHTNIPMILAILIMLCFGMVVLYSVSAPDAYGLYGDSAHFLKSQLGFTIAGFIACLLVGFLPPRLFDNRFVMFGSYAVSLLLAIVTLLFGAGGAEHGASRWLTIGSIQFQTSEVIKVALIISFAGWRSLVSKIRKKGRIKAKNPGSQMIIDAAIDFIIPVVMCALVDVFIALQPHVSCFIIIASVIFMCALSSEIPIKSWIVGGLITLLIGAIILTIGLAVAPASTRDRFMNNYAHVFKRIAIYNAEGEEGEEEDITSDDTRQVDNAMNALGSGGMWGVGIGNSRAKYNYVSEAQNDYIFSIYVEETGFVGGLILILLYVGLFCMCMTVIWRADGVYARTVATGCTTLIFVEVFMNLAVELQVIPSTGVTLPFMSYGGTAQISLLIAYGFILQISRYATKPKQIKEEKSA
ncbi:MAG: FtsW/RodA/SpoVE family cell cycle protein [Saccharofermentans sp.]|nr:FtsW/RodA/SpoVE family cell cycle protein [Saccharofermentans sp.]